MGILGGGQKLKRGLNLWTVSVSFFKKGALQASGTVEADERAIGHGLHLSRRLCAPARDRLRRMDQAVGRRAAGHCPIAPRLCRAQRMAPAAPAQRGPGLPHLCPRRGVAGRRQPLERHPLARSRGAAWTQPAVCSQTRRRRQQSRPRANSWSAKSGRDLRRRQGAGGSLIGKAEGVATGPGKRLASDEQLKPAL